MAASLPGCGGGEFGETVRVAPERRSSTEGAFAAGQALSLPADRAFNVVDARRSSNGEGKSESRAEPSGSASCSASAGGGGGDAQAEFQLGHVVENRGDHPIDITVRVRVDYAYQFDGDRSVRDHPADGFGLKFYIMDTDKRVYKRVSLAGLSDELGPEAWSGVQSPSFDVRLEQGRAYHLVLAGRVEVGGGPPPSSARIEVKSLRLELVPRGVAVR